MDTVHFEYGLYLVIYMVCGGKDIAMTSHLLKIYNLKFWCLFSMTCCSLLLVLFPSISPSFFPQVTVKLLLSQLLVHRIVCSTQPTVQSLIVCVVKRMVLQVLLEVICTPRARVHSAENIEEPIDFRFVLCARFFRVLRAQWVYECPRWVPQSLNIRWILPILVLRYRCRHLPCGHLEI